MYKATFLMAVIIVVTGCATAPTQEMSDARQAVQAARDAGAPKHVPIVMDSAERQLTQAENELRGRDYKSARDEAVGARQQAVKARNMTLAISQAKEAVEQARQAGALTQVTLDWLARAEAASTVGDEEEVMRATQQVRQEALDDIRRHREERIRAVRENQDWLEQVQPLITEIQAAKARLLPEQQQRFDRAAAFYQQEQGRQAYDIANGLVKEIRALPPLVRTKQYEVQAGDTLWRIAGKKETYGNSLWWPLIFRSNRAAISGADGLRVGQILMIELNPDPALVRQAEAYARLRDGTAEIIKKMDRKFLGDDK